MVYHVYIDVVFFVNLIMDTAVLIVVKKLLKLRAKGVRIILAGAIGAIWACAMAIYPVLWAPLEALITWFVIGGLMVKIAFATKGLRSLIQGMLVLYLAAVTLGGTMYALHYHTRFGYVVIQLMNGHMMKSLPLVVIILLAAGALFLGRYLWMNFLEIQYRRENLYEVILTKECKTIKTTGLLDTGNRLYEPVSHQPVHVVSQNIWNEFYEAGGPCLLIPYHTIGTQEGMMPGLYLDSMEILGEQSDRSIVRPLIAVSSHPLNKAGEGYEILLHGEH